MSRPEGGYYLYLNPSLLNDERFAALTPTQHGAWTILFMALEYERRWGWFRDRDRATFWLTRFGWRLKDAVAAVDGLKDAGWLVAENDDSPAFTLRGWHDWAAKGRKQEINANRGDRSEEYQKRPTTRAGRRRSVTERDGDVTARDGDREENERKNVPPQTPPTRGGRHRVTERHDVKVPTPLADVMPGSLKAKLAEYGYTPVSPNHSDETPNEAPSTEGLTADGAVV